MVVIGKTLFEFIAFFVAIFILLFVAIGFINIIAGLSFSDDFFMPVLKGITIFSAIGSMVALIYFGRRG